MKKILIIAYYTFKQNLRQKLFLATLSSALILLLISILMGEMAVSEQKRFILDFAMAITQIMTVFLAIVNGSYQTRDEIDKSVTSVIITKAVKRSQYLLGKYLGGLLSLAVNLLGLLLFTLTIFYFQHVEVTPLYFLNIYTIALEAAVVLAFAMSFSLISSTLVSLSASLGLTIAGHFSQDFYLLSQKGHGLPRLMGKAVYLLLPNLEKFNLKAFVVYNLAPTASLLVNQFCYALIFTVLFLLANTYLFKRMDLQ